MNKCVKLDFNFSNLSFFVKCNRFNRRNRFSISVQVTVSKLAACVRNSARAIFIYHATSAHCACAIRQNALGRPLLQSLDHFRGGSALLLERRIVRLDAAHRSLQMARHVRVNVVADETRAHSATIERAAQST